MPNIITQGAGSAQGYGFLARTGAPVYIEDVFATAVYSGNGGTQTITTGLDLSTQGGLVWIKNRTNTGGVPHAFTDTARGPGTGTTNTATNVLTPDSTGGTGGSLPANGNDYLSAFGTTGFTVISSNGANNSTQITNRSGSNYVAWSFEKKPKFFDIVTYTGNGSAGARAIPHNLGSVPGCMIVKYYSGTTPGGTDWYVYHRGLTTPATQFLRLANTAGQATSTIWGSTAPIATEFYVATTTLNQSGTNYVVYLFAHDAGGFGLSGSDNVISCGSYTGNGSASGPTVTLGYEPQWLLIKRSQASTSNSWCVYDNMRGLSFAASPFLQPNTTGAESTGTDVVPTATGFRLTSTSTNTNSSGSSYVYIAIRQGLMRVPTNGTSVFTPSTRTGTGATATFSGAGFPVDASWVRYRGSAEGIYPEDRLRGANRVLDTTSTALETVQTQFITDFASMTGYSLGTNSGVNGSGLTYINWDFRRARGFFDVVCYTGTGATATVSHNLGVAPELMLIKRRSGASPGNWAVYANGIGLFTLVLNNTNAKQADFNAYFANTTPTASVFTVGADADTNASGSNYLAYLFATCAGVSKVGTYTGAGVGTAVQVNCGFSSGARFILIKRVDSAGNWAIWDSARGIIAGNDPYIIANSTVSEVTATDDIDPYAAGFEISSSASTLFNASGGVYVYLAIA